LAPLSVMPPAADVMLIGPALLVVSFADISPLTVTPPLAPVTVILGAISEDVLGITICPPAPLVTRDIEVLPTIVPVVNTSLALSGFILMVVPIAFTAPANLPVPVTLTG
jgi:hypothetical protein